MQHEVSHTGGDAVSLLEVFPVSHEVMQDTDSIASRPLLLTHRIEKPRAFRLARVGVGTALGLIVVLGLIILAAAYPALGLAILAIGILVVLVGIICVWIDRRVRLSSVLRGVAGRSDGDLREIVEELVQLGGLDADFPPLGKLPAALADAGQLGQTVQVGWDDALASIEPLTVAFEPRLLDETDEAFDELAQAATSGGATVDGPVEESPTNHRDRVTLRRLQRSFKLQGSWAIIIVLIQLINTGMDSWERGFVTWPFLVFFSTFLLLMFWSTRAGSFSKEQWLIVPGSLLLRGTANRGREVSLHLFDRRRSVLSLQQQQSGRWHVAVADAETSEGKIITDRERQLLLRAWLSPVPPPPVGELVDLS